jgi:hypothetical protein
MTVIIHTQIHSNITLENFRRILIDMEPGLHDLEGGHHFRSHSTPATSSTNAPLRFVPKRSNFIYSESPTRTPALPLASVHLRLLVRSVKETTGSVIVLVTRQLHLPEQEDRLEAALSCGLTLLLITVLQNQPNLHLLYHHVSNFLRLIKRLYLTTGGPISLAKLLHLLVQTLLLRTPEDLRCTRMLPKLRNSRKTTRRRWRNVPPKRISYLSSIRHWDTHLPMDYPPACVKPQKSWTSSALHPYLDGSNFILYTDHSALQWLFDFKGTDKRILCWSMELLPYKRLMVIKYRPGRVNENADLLWWAALPYDSSDEDDELPLPEEIKKKVTSNVATLPSFAISSVEVAPIFKRQLQEGYQKDPVTSQLIQQIKAGKASVKHFKLTHDGLLIL